MSFDFNQILGVHEKALNLQTKRAEVLANNLVNADTPGYLARDFDFKSMLEDQADHVQVLATHQQHLPVTSLTPFSPELSYRQSAQPSLDGNTVDGHIEKSKFVENMMSMQASHAFLSGKIRGLMLAIRGD